MTAFLPILRDQQKLIFDLGNLVNKKYTASFHVVLTASYFTIDTTIPVADLIFPLSAQKTGEDEASIFTFPEEAAVQDIVLPRNMKKAIFTIAATGQYEEEVSGSSRTNHF